MSDNEHDHQMCLRRAQLALINQFVGKLDGVLERVGIMADEYADTNPLSIGEHAVMSSEDLADVYTTLWNEVSSLRAEIKRLHFNLCGRIAQERREAHGR